MSSTPPRRTSLAATLASAGLLLCVLSAEGLVAASPVASLSPRSTTSEGIYVPLTRRANKRTPADFLSKARKVKSKYSSSKELAKRAGTLTLTDEQDSEYYGTISIGTSDFNVILDTGSTDLLIATSGCSGCESSTPAYDSSTSSTSDVSSTAFSITYGTGSASGVLVTDTVSIAGYSVSNQTFAACDTINNISIASSGAVPVVQALAQSGSLPEEVFAFALESYSATDITDEPMPGGSMTIGSTSASMYSGDINWIDIVLPGAYWAIALDGVAVGGTDLALSTAEAVIDTGTFLIGALAAAVDAIYAQISGSAAITLSGENGYYSYPCTSKANVTFTFGGVDYLIGSDFLNAGVVDEAGENCLGAIFTMDESSSISWIFGDSFLASVYSAYRFSDPPAVGFATLGSDGISYSSSSSSSTAVGAASVATSSASPPSRTNLGVSLVVGIVAGLFLTVF